MLAHAVMHALKIIRRIYRLMDKGSKGTTRDIVGYFGYLNGVRVSHEFMYDHEFSFLHIYHDVEIFPA